MGITNFGLPISTEKVERTSSTAPQLPAAGSRDRKTKDDNCREENESPIHNKSSKNGEKVLSPGPGPRSQSHFPRRSFSSPSSTRQSAVPRDIFPQLAQDVVLLRQRDELHGPEQR